MSTQPSVIERTRETQCDRLLRLLKWADGQWVNLPHILNLGIASHTKIISLLREKGHVIDIDREQVGGQLRTRYRLVKA